MEYWLPEEQLNKRYSGRFKGNLWWRCSWRVPTIPIYVICTIEKTLTRDQLVRLVSFFPTYMYVEVFYKLSRICYLYDGGSHYGGRKLGGAREYPRPYAGGWRPSNSRPERKSGRAGFELTLVIVEPAIPGHCATPHPMQGPDVISSSSHMA